MLSKVLCLLCNRSKDEDNPSERYSIEVNLTDFLNAVNALFLNFNLMSFFFYMLFCMIKISLFSREDAPECNSISSVSVTNDEISSVVEPNTSVSVSVESLRETICDVCNHLDDSVSLDLSLNDSSIQTDWKLIWWRDLRNFDEVLLLLFTYYIFMGKL